MTSLLCEEEKSKNNNNFLKNMPCALSNLSALLLPPTHEFKSGNGSSIYVKNRPTRLLPMKAKMAMGVRMEGKDNLDHLQRVGKAQQQQQQQPKRRVVQYSPIGLWDRFPSARTVQQMMDTMDRILEDPFAYRTDSYPSGGGEESVGSYRRGRTPWEIKEGVGEYKMRFDMPGMTKKDVKVSVEEKTLVVKAEKIANGGEEEEWSAKSYGRYNSRIELPDNVEVEKIKAEVKDGVLYITIPKVSSSSKVLDVDVQ